MGCLFLFQGIFPTQRSNPGLLVSCTWQVGFYHWVTWKAFYYVVQLLSHVWLFVTWWTAACQAFMSFTMSWSFLRLKSIESVMPSKHLIFCCPLLLPSNFPSIRVFSNESILHIRWLKYWSFSISPSNEYLVLISFRIEWFYLLDVQGTLQSLFQHYSSKASNLWHSTFFIVQLS